MNIARKTQSLPRTVLRAMLAAALGLLLCSPFNARALTVCLACQHEQSKDGGTHCEYCGVKFTSENMSTDVYSDDGEDADDSNAAETAGVTRPGELSAEARAAILKAKADCKKAYTRLSALSISDAQHAMLAVGDNIVALDHLLGDDSHLHKAGRRADTGTHEKCFVCDGTGTRPFKMLQSLTDDEITLNKTAIPCPMCKGKKQILRWNSPMGGKYRQYHDRGVAMARGELRKLGLAPFGGGFLPKDLIGKLTVPQECAFLRAASRICDACNGYGYDVCRKCNGFGYGKCGGRGCVMGQVTTQAKVGLDKAEALKHNVKCDVCGGRGAERCEDCSGRGRVACAKCGGTGLAPDCQSCHGQGYETCKGCKGTGAGKDGSECKMCGGDGVSKCARCHGTGHPGK